MLKKIILCVIVCFAFGFTFELSVTNILPVFIGILFLFAASHCNFKKYNRKDLISIALFSAVFTVFLTFAQIENILRFKSNIMCLGSAGISVIGLYAFFFVFIERIVDGLRNDSLVIGTKKNRYKPVYIFIGAFVALVLFWGCSFLISFPGLVSVDSLENLEQAVGTRPMDVLFPFYMTLYLRFCWNVGILIWGSGNAGIALYCVTQMLVLALVVAYLIYRLYKCNIKFSLCVAVLFYFVLVPYHAHSSITLLKDIPYAIGTLLFMLLMWEFYTFNVSTNKVKRIFKYGLFILAGILMAVSRANGYYVFLFCLPFAIYLFAKKDKKIMLVLFLTLFSVMLVRGPVFDFIITRNNQYIGEKDYPVFDVRYKNAESVSKNEEEEENEMQTVSVSASQTNNASAEYGATGIFIVTAQQLGRVAVDRELTQAEYERLNSVINVEGMKEKYREDIVTGAMNQITNWNTKEYLSVWLEFGLKYPYTYFIAWRDQTDGYWNPEIMSGGMELEFFEKNPEVYADSVFPQRVVEIRNRINEIIMYDIPVVSILWCNGFIVWLTFFAIALTVIKRNIRTALIYAPLIGLWGTLLVANPCDGQFRYIYSFFLCLPLSLLIPFVKGQGEEKNDEHLLHQQ